MSKFICFTLLFLSSVQAERKNDIVPEKIQNLNSKSLNIPRTDIYQPDFHQMHRYRDIRSPAVEVMMHLPPQFENVESFKRFLGLKPERIKRETKVERSKRKVNDKGLVDVRSYGFSQVLPERKKRHNEDVHKREKREANIPDSETVESRSLKIENDPRIESEKFLPPSMMESRGEGFPETLIEMPAPIRGPIYTSYPIDNLEIDPEMDPDDLRKRRNTSANDHDESNQRDKRTFMEGENRESTTAPPFWKRKKDNPPFVTGRDGRTQKNNNYTPPQHRSADNARESHSMKDLEKSVQSNEIPRSNQDSYYSSTNRRTYNSRQAENFTPSTPKSVYDTIDYSNRARSQDSRRDYGRAVDGGREGYERSRAPLDSGTFSRQYAYPKVYDRYYYPYPYPGDVLGRGVEYYHRTYDPSSGRIVYYANMPEPTRGYDPNLRTGDPHGRSFYVNGRTYVYDPYGRSYILPYDYRFVDGYGRPMDYMRNGRSSAEAYGADKFSRDARYEGRYNSDRYKDDFRNKTYVIFDAEESRSQYPRASYAPPDVNRYPGYPAPPSTQTPYRQLPTGPAPSAGPYTPYPYRNQYYPPAPPTPWGNNARPLVGGLDPNFTPRPYNSPDVQLPLTNPTRNMPPTSAYDKLQKT